MFRLSKDLSQAEAETRIRQIESLWRESVAACRRPDDLHQNIDDQWGPVVWDESRLELARAIAKGTPLKLERLPFQTSVEYVKELATIQQAIGAKVEGDETAVARGLESLRNSTHRTNNRIGALLGVEGIKLVGQRLHDALRAYIVGLKRSMSITSRAISRTTEPRRNDKPRPLAGSCQTVIWANSIMRNVIPSLPCSAIGHW